MLHDVVEAPASLLTAPDLPATHKLLWLVLRRHAEPVSRARLAASSGLNLHTIRKALAQLEAAGWYSPQAGAVARSASGPHTRIPAGLLSEPRVRPQAKLLYGILQTLPAAQATYASLSQATHVSVITIRQSVQELARAGWIQVQQAHKFAPIRFTLQVPEDIEVAQAKKRLEEADHKSEAIMREYLSLLIDSDEFEENARPGFLVNPLTNERMELDRYYFAGKVAFEYNGPQHFRTTKRFPSEQQLTKQQARDLMKEAICARRGISLVVITRADLTLKTMRRKVAPLMPLRNLAERAALVTFLEQF